MKEEDEAPGTSSGSHDHAPGCSHCQAKKLGDVTTLNLTMLRAGVSLDEGKTFALNVIPTTAEAGLDVRVTPNTPIPEICAMLDRWCAEEGGLSWKFAPWAGKHLEEHYTTSVDPAKNPWWAAFAGACDRMGMKLVPEIFPAGTDSRFVRQLGLNALGFSPMAKSPILLHEHNEYIARDVFLHGVGVYESLIPALGNAEA